MTVFNLKLCIECHERPPAGPASRWCLLCRRKRMAAAWKARQEAGQRHWKLKYEWTPERDELLRQRYDPSVRLRAQEIAAELGFPAWCVKKRAGVLGLTRKAKRQNWTRAEVEFLVANVGKHRVEWIAKILHRSISSVVLKAKRLRISRKFRDGYTSRQLAEAFGEDSHKITRWISDGKLRATRAAGEVNGRGLVSPQKQAWYIREEDVFRFVVLHPQEVRLDTVDPEWFWRLLGEALRLHMARLDPPERKATPTIRSAAAEQRMAESGRYGDLPPPLLAELERLRGSG